MNLDAVNIYYKPYMSEIGGVETMTYNLAYKYRHKNIMFLFGGCHPRQLPRLLELGVPVVQYDKNKTYRCKRCFIAFDTDIPENIESEEGFFRIGHNNFKVLTGRRWKLPTDCEKSINFAVSKDACEAIEEIVGGECRYCPNPYIPINPKPLLKLVSPQRISWEKGSERIRYMAEELDRHDIPFQWTIITNSEQGVKDLGNKSIVYLQARLDVFPYVKDADYLVLLSEVEGSPMAPQEAMMMGVPIIVTDLAWVKDLNIDSNYGFFLKKDMSDLDVEEIYRRKGTFNFTFTPPEDIWDELLLDGETDMEYEPIGLYMVRATKEAADRNIVIPEAGGVPPEGKEFMITEDRLNALTGNNPYHCVFVTVVKKISRNELDGLSEDTDQP